MKTTAFVICLMLTSLPLFAQDSILIHPDVGYTVDPIENEYYRIAPGYSFKKFKFAKLYKVAGETYLQVFYGNIGTSIPKTESELASMRKSIELKGPITGNSVYVEVADSLKYNGLLQAIDDSTITVALDYINTVELVREEISDFGIYSEDSKLRGSVYLTMTRNSLINVNFDIPLVRKQKFNLFFSPGLTSSFGLDGLAVRASFPMLFGSEGKYFEFSPGVLPTSLGILPTALLGYRFQPADRNIVFRAGGGFPEVIYLSVGFQLGR